MSQQKKKRLSIQLWCTTLSLPQSSPLELNRFAQVLFSFVNCRWKKCSLHSLIQSYLFWFFFLAPNKLLWDYCDAKCNKSSSITPFSPFSASVSFTPALILVRLPILIWFRSVSWEYLNFFLSGNRLTQYTLNEFVSVATIAFWMSDNMLNAYQKQNLKKKVVQFHRGLWVNRYSSSSCKQFWLHFCWHFTNW